MMLHTFMLRPGQVLTRELLLDHAWDLAYERGSNVVDVYVRSLREKLDRPFGVTSLETVRGVGYRLRSEPK
jgi:two-component system OmpR family response regulator